jgi:hypothetical protein
MYVLNEEIKRIKVLDPIGGYTSADPVYVAPDVH